MKTITKLKTSPTLMISQKWTLSLKKSMAMKIGSHLWNIVHISNWKKKKEIEIQRRNQRAFIAFETGSKLISEIGSGNHNYEDQIVIGENYIRQFKTLFNNNNQLTEGLEKQLYYKRKQFKIEL